MTMPTPKTNSSNAKYIFVTGGVLSGLGKGVVVASLGKLISLHGIKVTCAKIDPYINVDAGTMNPLIHGEVFVTDDGGETDMDLGTYERFLDRNMSKENNLTTGQVYLKVIQAERRGDLLGKCIQIIPHVTDAIKDMLKQISVNQGGGLLIVEIGGTVGDIESLPFLEAVRQIGLDEESSDTLFVHVTLAPVLGAVGEEKTKPTQHSVQELRRIGIQPDILVVRSVKTLSIESKRKISLFTSVELENIISNPDSTSIYTVPENLYDEGIIDSIKKKLSLREMEMAWGNWRNISRSFSSTSDEIKIGMIGKYVSLADSYVSVNHALQHAASAQNTSAKVEWVDSSEFENDIGLLSNLDIYDGILIPGGFGKRGSEGKILTANYAREKSIPFLGLCLGFQLAIVAFGRYACNIRDAHSAEIDPDTKNPVIDLLPDQKGIGEMGATMRLGGHDIEIVDGSLAHKVYSSKTIRQRHRHRFEFNSEYLETFESTGLKLTGFSDERRRAEILEIPSHPFYMATQYHPEFVSRPDTPEPIFSHFIRAAIVKKRTEVIATES